MKWTNRIIIGLVISLLLAVLILLITILCGFDTKMITDWIVAFSTAGTTAIAYMAYRKAPHWFESKHNEARYDQSSKIMSLLDESLDKLITVSFDVIAITDRDKSNKQCFELGSSLIKVREFLNACPRYNIVPKQELKVLVDDMLNQTSDYIGVIVGIKSLTDPSIQEKLNSIRNRHQKLSSTELRTLFKFD
ncbi:hypothetical protein [Serratia ureilytica]|uniref:hypothetical protein n=1 Tax=Serratia ureilytica TaxID=300181 RepID=UPI002FE53FB9